MKAFKVTRTDEDQGYDTFDSFVVVTTDEERAREIVPGHCMWEDGDEEKIQTYESMEKGLANVYISRSWVENARKDTLEIEYIGRAKGPERYILCSFNAG